VEKLIEVEIESKETWKIAEKERKEGAEKRREIMKIKKNEREEKKDNGGLDMEGKKDEIEIGGNCICHSPLKCIMKRNTIYQKNE